MPEISAKKIPWKNILPPSFLVAGNVLGVGILALPIKLGVSGFAPSILDLVVICLLMLISAFVIAERLPVDKANFDIPSFFHQELGSKGRWIAVVCNLILLYGVLVAYLSGISCMLHALFPFPVSRALLTSAYFLLATSLVLFGRKVLRRGNTILLIAIWICFGVLIASGTSDFHWHLLTYTDWRFLPIGLPVVVSAFHFHNIIPTVSNCVDRDKKALRKVITIGVTIGFVMNLVWVIVVMGSLPEFGPHKITIVNAFLHNMPATVPMTELLHSHTFALSALLFATLAVTASYVANGAGLFGFIKDLTSTYIKSESTWLVGILAFLPPLVITLVYPNIFLDALDVVGGIGETILFAILPGIILVKLAKNKSRPLRAIGMMMAIIGAFIFIFIVLEKFGLIGIADIHRHLMYQFA
ncbi:MAG: tryptophan/tyrosine permease [Gammaproteobacteria bacterium]|nr:tryptophan/tyrosine permease [Gammaproteobacteria bacterium]